jgi:cation:H+ antiporter
MEILVQAALLLIGLGILIKGADVFVESSCRIARAIGVSELFIGLTLVAAGTSFPELAVSTLSSLAAHDDISVANIVGSNIYNIFIIIGITAILMRQRTKDSKIIDRDAVWVILASVAFTALSFTGLISREAGLLMILAYVVYIATLYFDSKSGAKQVKHGLLTARDIAVCVGGLALVIVGGHITVGSASSVAALLGVPEWLIGATIVAAGTSMPETITSLIAVRKGKVELSLGNILGSNIFNILVIMGASAVLKPLTVAFATVAMDYVFMLLAAVFVTAILLRGNYGRGIGVLSLLFYAAYIALVVLRG